MPKQANLPKKKIPQFLQPVLWSVKISQLDLLKDKVYIINQILAFGDLKDLKWLFKNYPVKIIEEIFIHQPVKTYRAPTYNFAKEILLDLEDTNLVKEKYVINTPRTSR